MLADLNTTKRAPADRDKLSGPPIISLQHRQASQPYLENSRPPQAGSVHADSRARILPE